MKIFKRILILIAVILAVILYFNYSKLNIISGYAAKNMASTLNLTQRSAASMTANDHNIPMIKLANTTINKEEKSASAKVFGFMERKAVFRDGLGAVLLRNDDDINTITVKKPKRTIYKNGNPFPYGNNGHKDSVFSNIDYSKLNKAMDAVFSNPEIRKTRTAIVIYKDHIIAEKYLEGFNKDTPILGWSMTKSILATVYGVLEHQGKIDVMQMAPIKEWQKDERKQISINHLLRMQSGLEWDENYDAISDVTKMLFLDADMTKNQLDKKSIAKPTEIWNYSSGTSNLLSGILRSQFSTYQEYLDFPYTNFIDKIGMNSMLIETDLSGNYVGSSYGWATTRDWAKFGLLYLHKGNWDGNQIFSNKWVDYISKPTLNSDGTYGAHFWLNANGQYPDVPKYMFSANGYQGQHVFIIPSKDLVVVRTGLAERPNFDINKFLSDIIGAIE